MDRIRILTVSLRVLTLIGWFDRAFYTARVPDVQQKQITFIIVSSAPLCSTLNWVAVHVMLVTRDIKH